MNLGNDNAVATELVGQGVAESCVGFVVLAVVGHTAATEDGYAVCVWLMHYNVGPYDAVAAGVGTAFQRVHNGSVFVVFFSTEHHDAAAFNVDIVYRRFDRMYDVAHNGIAAYISFVFFFYGGIFGVSYTLVCHFVAVVVVYGVDDGVVHNDAQFYYTVTFCLVDQCVINSGIVLVTHAGVFVYQEVASFYFCFYV